MIRNIFTLFPGAILATLAMLFWIVVDDPISREVAQPCPPNTQEKK